MSTLKVNALQDTSGKGFYPARVWVNFDQTGTLTINSDGGVSSLTDDGTGLGRITFSNTMSNVNYAFNGAVNTYFSSTRWDVHCIERNLTNFRSTSNVPFNAGYGGYAEYDFDKLSAVVTV